MIANITKGADFGGLFKYLLHHSKSAEIIGGNVGGETPHALAAEFLAFANLNQRVRKPVNHMSLGFAPEDGTIDRIRQERIAARIVEEMGYGNAQYLVVAHGREDPGHDAHHDHDHLHIVANSVDLNGKWVDDFQSFRRMEAILRKVERDEGLRQIESSWEVKRNAPTHGQTQRIKREVREVAAGERETVTLAVSERLQMAIDKAANQSRTVIEFARSLASDGISTQFKVTRTGKVQGISYNMEGVKFQGNQLFDASLPKLQSVRGLSFEPLTDPKIIAAIEINPDFPVFEITRHIPTPQPQTTPIADETPVDLINEKQSVMPTSQTKQRQLFEEGNPLNHLKNLMNGTQPSIDLINNRNLQVDGQPVTPTSQTRLRQPVPDGNPLNHLKALLNKPQTSTPEPEPVVSTVEIVSDPTPLVATIEIVPEPTPPSPSTPSPPPPQISVAEIANLPPPPKVLQVQRNRDGR
jgi:Relaxase/Mobilisation nuclease domain